MILARTRSESASTHCLYICLRSRVLTIYRRTSERRPDRGSAPDGRYSDRRSRRRSASPTKLRDGDDDESSSGYRDRYPPINKTWGHSSSLDRYVPSENYDKFARRIDRYAPRQNINEYVPDYDSGRLSPERKSRRRSEHEEGRSNTRRPPISLARDVDTAPDNSEEEIFATPEGRLSGRLSVEIDPERRLARSQADSGKSSSKKGLDNNFSGRIGDAGSSDILSESKESGSSFATRLGSKSQPLQKSENSSDFASRLSSKDKGRRRRAHHLDFD